MFNGSQCSHTQSFINFMLSFELNPLIRRTRPVTRITATLIDHLWTNYQTVTSSGIIRSKISVYYSVFDTSRCNNEESKVFQLVTYRNMCQANKKLLKEKLPRFSWDALYASNSIDEAYGLFSGRLTEQYEACFPLCTSIKKVLDLRKP